LSSDIEMPAYHTRTRWRKSGYIRGFSMLRIGNCSGFWGDRFQAAEEMVRGGPIDVLTGDYLAELTMAILHKSRQKNPRAGFVPTFLKQMERVLGECLSRGVKVVANAGGLNPRGLAEELEALAAKLGLEPRVAWVDGDDLTARLGELQAAGERFTHLDRGGALADSPRQVVTANAYLGGWGIREALARGADIVVTGRVTDAALVVGPAAWRFGWRRNDWDRLAGAVAAGHVIECSAQATGGNYAFYKEEVRELRRVGFPIVEMHEDGSFVVTKHPGTGGRVTVGTVTAQLLYEIEGPRYANPDVVARFDTLALAEEAEDRVRVSGARGEPAPATLKVCINHAGGWRNQMLLLLGGLDLEEKARLVGDLLFDALGGRERFDTVDEKLLRLDEEGMAYLRITVTSADRERVGRAFSDTVVAQALSSVPGYSSRTPPDDASPFLIYWPASIARRHVEERVHIGNETIVIPPPDGEPGVNVDVKVNANVTADGKIVRAPLGRAFGARSGDKGGNANLGVWAPGDAGFAWLDANLTVDLLKSLVPSLAPYTIDRHRLPNLRALNFYIRGLLGEGVASSTRTDPQAKILGEILRAREVDLPESLIVSRS
jgi:hypothetical protein